MTYDQEYKARLEAFEAALERTVDRPDIPSPLLEAMRYSLLAGGKRIRPMLLLSFARMWPGGSDADTAFACALEMIHTYSLVHDDLPAMDDDDLRRAKPTCHIVFGEGMAVLAGDGLLNLAYETMFDACGSAREIRAAKTLARSAGVTGMIAGQCLDLSAEAKGEHNNPEELLTQIHTRKTGALLTAPILCGLTLCNAPQAALEAGERFGHHIGLAFQIQDDILDVTGDAAQLGKQTGMDAQNGKLTFAGVYGLERAEEMARGQLDCAGRALNALIGCGAAAVQTAFIGGLLEYLAGRRQ